jgi:hypothetical protein
MSRVILAVFPLLPLLAACVDAGAGNPSVARAVAAGDGLCPSPDPARDGPLVDAIRADDATAVEALLVREPSDTRARAALAVISGRGTVDPDEAACFAPYLS